MPILALNGICKRFGAHIALDDVSLAVEPGEVVAIIGRSGSGKTTLLRCINGLEVPDSGEIVFDGRQVERSRAGLQALRREIGIVFQSFNLFPHLTVERNITLGPTVARGLPLAEAKERARKVLRQVDLEDKIAAVPLRLSGGQQQRVAIARSLAMQPRLMLFDEITSALDPELVGEVINVLEKSPPTAAICDSKRPGDAADTVVFMHQGKIWEKGPPRVCSPPAKRSWQRYRRYRPSAPTPPAILIE
jgi:polar amino acid transport system ATP-binding protein